jgi:hypothetical protein
MSPQTKAVVRAFLETSAAKEWLEHGRNSYPELKLGDASDKAYDISLHEANGWRKGILYLSACVRDQAIPDYGLTPIDTVRD